MFGHFYSLQNRNCSNTKAIFERSGVKLYLRACGEKEIFSEASTRNE